MCAALLTGCARVRMEIEPALPSCRATIPSDLPVRWVSSFHGEDRRHMRAWCDPLGPVVRAPAPTAASPVEAGQPLMLVAWNMEVANGRLAALVEELRREHSGHMVLMLQEAFREGDVPADCPPRSGLARRIGASRGPKGPDIFGEARALGLAAVYVPSMRNGRDCAEEPREDRGNAILSTLPLDDVVVIELPFTMQRRAAAGATLRPWGRPLHVVSVHLDVVLGHWRQAKGLWQAVDRLGWTDPVVVGGDFNTLLFDMGPREMRARGFTEWACGNGGTHRSGFRLDRIFSRGLTASPACRTSQDRFGSDHRPVIALLQEPGAP